ncbi:MAG: HAD-IIIA family hydrolase [Chloroflexi bacterium]|nr:HAD-IIIA family hydrolase [Chloroflexota bacterium]
MAKRRAVFLDRDGVINANRQDHVKCWEEFRFLPGALQALRELAGTRFVVLVTTNQSAIGRGQTTEPAVCDIHARMLAAVQQAGGRVDGVYYCPHSPDAGCDCRKPKTGLYDRGLHEWDVDAGRSFVVGDAVPDIVAARAIGAQPILVLTGRGSQQRELLKGDGLAGCEIADDLSAAVRWIRQWDTDAE